ncbi:Phospholipase D1 [Cyphellophora attinorum]|uniref:phospholipase D n=1 Tax=Cyphellophora attinorum TaxID=1664694 RepID=A0A0N1HA25_9EURO|nr:Phospholipase D1 [Phialophora attinorum]KPI40705.1 Phospholipase D1 [Phialophora attinorum]
MKSLREKLKDTKLYDVKVGAIHTKNKLGKVGNLFNRNHRHDEAHEKATDEKRTKICESHRFKSFFPERPNNKIKWYVDGRDYFWAVSVALENAKETIYIADWWLSPELFLRRPPYFNQEWRLDMILKRAAERGVQIYVTVYKEVQQALTCNSAHTKHALRALCPEGTPGHGNIHIQRHPDHNLFENLGDMTFYWAHHEKFIVVDYELAFIGGLDMCYGRWDVRHHALADVHPSGVQNEIWPGQDFNNNRIMDFHTVTDWMNNELNKTDFGRMPWHDVAMAVIGDCVVDIAEHFVLRWNHVKRDKYKRDEKTNWLLMETRGNKAGTNPDEDLIAVQRPKHPVGDYVEHPLSPLQTKALGNQGTVHAQLVRSSDDWSSGILNDQSIQNAYKEVIENAQHYVYIENQFFITATGENQAPIQNTIGRAIADACIRAAREGRKFRVIIVIPAIPGFAGDLREDAAIGTRAIMDYQYKSINRGEHSIMGQIRAAGFDPTQHIFVFNLRAFDRINKTPGLIQQEKDSGVTRRNNGLRHSRYDDEDTEKDAKDQQHTRIGDDERQNIIDRKRRFEAARKNIDAEDPIHSADSVAEDLMARGGLVSEEPWEGEIEDEKHNFVQEELYIHAKLLIVDDRTVICGSSNLNDRSQLGSHDSELSIVMTDTRMMDSTMDGQPYQAGYHAATLRRHLWREHLGMIEAQELDAKNDPNAQPPTVAMNETYSGEEWEFVADPLGDAVWEKWCHQATVNTNQYRYMFRADPDDNITTWDEYDHFAPRKTIKQGHLHDPYMPAAKVREELDKIRGHLVWMPLKFLEKEEMAEKGLQVNAYTESVYT